MHLDMCPCGGDQNCDELVVVAVLDGKKHLCRAERTRLGERPCHQNRAHVSPFVLSLARMSRLFSVMICLMLGASAFALTGNAPPAAGWAARPIVMIVDTRDDLCTGTALAQDLVLTAAHCVVRPVQYTVKAYQTGESIPVRSI